MSGLEEIAAGLSAHHLEILDRLANDQKLNLASRHQDKLRRKLRQLGLIAYCGWPRRWQISETGLQVRAHLKGEG